MKRKNRRYMKLNFWKYAASVVLCIAAAASCQNSDPVQVDPDPVFPQSVINKTVAAGESVDITIEPNLAWEVQISGEGSGNMFWLDDDGMKATRISSKEVGSVTITVVFSDDEEFDVNRVCEVTLKMAGQSKKIAVITRPSLGRTFELYAGVAADDGFTEDFGTDKVTAVTLQSFYSSAKYSMPIKVVTNYDWAVSYPSWLKVLDAEGNSVNGSQEGTTYLMLEAVLSEEVMNGAEGVVKFMDAENTEASFELAVSLPAFIDRIEYSLQTTFTFDAAGSILSLGGTYIEDVPAIIELFATENTGVYAVEWNAEGEYYGISYADWVTVVKNPYEGESGPLAHYTVEVSVPENTTSSERFADVFVVPASKADVAFEEWFDPNTGNLKDEFAVYIIGRISQAGIERDYITMSDNPEDVYEAVLAKYTESQWWASSLGTDNQFELVYSHEYSDAVLIFDKPFDSYKVYDYDFNEVPEDQLEDYWLTFNGFASNGKGRVYMDPSKFTRTDAEFPESFIVFYDASGKVLAGLSCRHTTMGSSVVAENIYKVASGDAELVHLPADSDLYMAINSNYSITEIYQLTTNDKRVFVEGLDQYEIWNAFGVDPVTFGELDSPISLEPASPNFYVYTGNGTEKAEALFIFQNQATDGSLVNFAAIYVVYDPGATIEMPPPFEFVNPDLVGGLAELGAYTGDMIAAIMDEQFGITADKIFELKYFDASASSVAAITVPNAPADNAAWNNYPVSPDYWLTCEVTDGQMTVYMSQAGMTDYFLFRDASGMPSYVLVCTLAE